LLLACLLASGASLATAGEEQKININTAGVTELMTLSGIGEATAKAIVAHREEHGPFKAVDDLVAVRGIGEKKLAGLRERLTVGTGAQPDKPSS
jgi:competence protein ComEA